MKYLQLSVFLFFSGAVCANNTICTQNATAFTLEYGYPLLAWQQYYGQILESNSANTWYHRRHLSTPKNREVVKPNVDTLYSSFVYDLSQSNIEITIPEVPESYFKLFSFFDPFGDNYANVGTSGFYKPGKYLIRPYDRPGGSPHIGLTNATSADYAGSINSPGIYGLVLTRWGVNSTDLKQVHQWQNECSSENVTISKNINPDPYPPIKSLISLYNTSAPPATNVLTLLPYFAPANAPADQFSAAGVSLTHRTYTPVASVNLEKANATAVKLAKESAEDPQDNVKLNNDWAVLSPKVIGIYGTSYALRTLVAETAYLALRNPFAIYPIYSNASAGESGAQQFSGGIKIGKDEALLVTFSAKPPLKEAGFWSLTAYNAEDYLIPNSEHVYALGDRSNLTYSDGTLVYGSGNGGGKNESYELLVQPANIHPPANWTSNWLPAPSGGGVTALQLRFYGAEKPLTDGSYVYPKMEKIAALRGNGNVSRAVLTGAAERPGRAGAALLAGGLGLFSAVVMW